MNLSKVYTVKSNAVRDMRKAISKGELAADASVVVVPSGFQVVLPAAPQAVPVQAEVVAIREARKATPLVPALPGMAVMGFVDAARSVLNGASVDDAAKALLPSDHGDEAEPATPKATLRLVVNAALARGEPAVVEVPVTPKPAAGKFDCGMALTSALATSPVWTTKGLPMSDRAGVWVLFESVHATIEANGLTKGQLPACTGSARKRGLIETEWSENVGLGKPRRVAVRLTSAGLVAHQGSVA
jgi:hypothetical protein